jgi:hypothetical protein
MFARGGETRFNFPGRRRPSTYVRPARTPVVPVSLRTSPEGRRLDVSRAVDAPPERCWDLLRDTERWPEWGPSLAAVESPTRYVEPGLAGRVKPVVGPWLPFRVTAVADRRWTWRVAGVPATGHRVEAGPTPTQCRVAIEVPPLAFPYVPVCVLALSRLAALASSSR